jgi:hypothetical protein
MSLCVINCNGLLVQMLEDVRNYRRIFDAGNHLDLSTTTLTGFKVDIEHALEALHPGHGTMLFLLALVEPIGTARLPLCCFLTTLCGSDLITVFAVGRKNALKFCQVNSRPACLSAVRLLALIGIQRSDPSPRPPLVPCAEVAHRLPS